MGATAADYEHTGRPGIFRSNFSDEQETLYRNRGKAEFDVRRQFGEEEVHPLIDTGRVRLGGQHFARPDQEIVRLFSLE